MSQLLIRASRTSRVRPWGMLFRNSALRQEISGCANFLRFVGFGFDITIEWGKYNRARLSPACRFPPFIFPKMTLADYPATQRRRSINAR